VRTGRPFTPHTANLENANVLEELDLLYLAATRGDRDAIGAILIAFGPTLLNEARFVLGTRYADEAPDVIAEFAEQLLTEELHFRPRRGDAIWVMRRTVRCIARGLRRKVRRFRRGGR
jgi:hypothetical protein